MLDGSNDYRISREGFLDTICVPADDEEGDNLGASFKASVSPSKGKNKSPDLCDTPSRFDAVVNTSADRATGVQMRAYSSQGNKSI